jgi:glucose/arabinose dehydrogenase
MQTYKNLGSLLTIVLTFCGSYSLSSVSQASFPTIPQGASQASDKRLQLTPHRISLTNGRSFTLNLPTDFEIAIAVQGLKRVRFMAKSPDNRIFVTDMYNLTDNKRGVVYILDDFDLSAKRFKKVTQFMTGLRNPNSAAFYTDTRGTNWFYLALTDRLVRYRYESGSSKPTGQPEVLATFPDYGLAYKYGGWHLTRTIAVGPNDKIYVSVGSSCNACEEKEDLRASVLEMDPDGKNQHFYARGLRNAVGLRWIDSQLYGTNMGADHLGKDSPADTLVTINQGSNFGWPYCYQTGGKIRVDPLFNPGERKLDCGKVRKAVAAFDAHSSPLGLEYFDSESHSSLRDAFLVALHGSTRKSLGRGYRVARVRSAGSSSVIENFITGFMENGVIHGRPADIMKFGKDGFLLTDDNAGVIYYVYRR